MADITWPASLPQSHFLGVKLRRQDAVVRTETDGGPSKLRPRFTSTYTSVVGKLVLTQDQVELFQTFYVTTLVEGSEQFDWYHPLDGTVATFQFTSVPEYTSIGVTADGPVWEVTLPLEIVP